MGVVAPPPRGVDLTNITLQDLMAMQLANFREEIVASGPWDRRTFKGSWVGTGRQGWRFQPHAPLHPADDFASSSPLQINEHETG